jgi:hypothetical protein
MIRIESASRWDALALAQRLERYHWFLVDRGHGHWDVYVSAVHVRPDLPRDLRSRLDAWVNERRIEEAIVHSEDQEVRLSCL